MYQQQQKQKHQHQHPIWTPNNKRRNAFVLWVCGYTAGAANAADVAGAAVAIPLLTFDRIWNILCSCLGNWSQMTFCVLFMRFCCTSSFATLCNRYCTFNLLFLSFTYSLIRSPFKRSIIWPDAWCMSLSVHFVFNAVVLFLAFIIDSIHTNWLKYEHPSISLRLIWP